MDIKLTPSIALDKKERPYLRCNINGNFLSPFITKMKQAIDEKKFSDLTNNRRLRDGEGFHITLINPIEIFEFFSGVVPKISNDVVNVRLIDLGYLKDGSREAWYIVVQSDDLQSIRVKLGLQQSDLHITLGFQPDDIYDLPKDESTLFKL